MTIAACVLFAAALLFYIFKPGDQTFTAVDKSRLAYLAERKDVVYDNLRDLNFDYSAGKYPQQDYDALRQSLENEAATLLAEIDRLERATA
jgi:hypothetical protein